MFIEGSGSAKVGELGRAVGSDEDVVGLEVAVGDAGGVQMGQSEEEGESVGLGG